MLPLAENPLWLNISLFLGAGVVVWLAGTRLTRYADAIGSRTGLGQALVGALVLGGITSLPELATITTAAVSGDPALAVNNVLGGVAMQIAILALADALIGERGLSTLAGTASLLLQGNGLMIVLALAAAGITAGSIVALGIDLWTTALFVVVIVVLAAIHRYEEHPYWEHTQDSSDAPAEGPDIEPAAKGTSEWTTTRLLALTALTGLVVVIAGFTVTRLADAIATQSALGASFVGAILLAAVTSLPELSTTMEAVRLGRHKLAFSNIFGTNLLDAGFLFIADVFYTEGAILGQVGSFSSFAALLGILLTGTYVAGILQRPKRVVFRMGVDSALVILLYLVGTTVMYGLR